MTNVPGIVLAVFTADCVPLLAVDSVHRAVGAAHSGWKGTVGDIAGELLKTMNREYGTLPSDVTAVIGPSICQDCYEVGEEVVEQFRAAYDRELWKDLFYQKEEQKAAGKYQLNLQEACRQNFLRHGVRPERVSIGDLCTKCNHELLFSHRMQGGKQGNLAAFLSIREQSKGFCLQQGCAAAAGSVPQE